MLLGLTHHQKLLPCVNTFCFLSSSTKLLLPRLINMYYMELHVKWIQERGKERERIVYTWVCVCVREREREKQYVCLRALTLKSELDWIQPLLPWPWEGYLNSLSLSLPIWKTKVMTLTSCYLVIIKWYSAYRSLSTVPRTYKPQSPFKHAMWACISLTTNPPSLYLSFSYSGGYQFLKCHPGPLKWISFKIEILNLKFHFKMSLKLDHT